jgi:hypothetical protein
MNVVTMSAVIGINVASPTANLQVQGNVFVSNAVSLANISATLGSNVGGLLVTDTATIGTLAGIRATAVAGGAAFNLTGNVYASNAVQTGAFNLATANLAGTGNVQRVVATTGFGIGAAAAGAFMNISGNIVASNALSAPSLFATTVNATTVNVLSASGGVGVGTASSSGTALNVLGNLYASNALVTTNLSMTTANIATLNVLSISDLVGVNTSAASGTDLNLLGNLYSSNALVTTNLTMTTGNVATLNVLSISDLVGVNTSAASGTDLNLLGNLYSSNALVTTNLSMTTGNVATLNTLAVYGQSGLVGVNTSAPSGTSLYVRGNVVTTKDLSMESLRGATINTTSMNIFTIYGTSGFVGLGTTAPSGTSLYVQGNVYTSADLSEDANVGGVAAITVNLLSISSYGPYINQAAFLDPTAWAQVPFSGSSLADVKGNLTSPTGTGTLAYTAAGGPSGKPSLVAAASSWVKYTLPDILPADPGITVSFWFKFNSTPAFSSYNNCLFSARTNSGGAYPLYFIFSGNNLQFYYSPSTTESPVTYLSGAGSVTGAWYHVAGVVTTSKTIIGYLNGSAVGTPASFTTGGSYVSTYALIGSFQDGGVYTPTVQTEFADVRIYDRALSAGEIITLYNSTVTTSPGFQVRGNTCVTGTISYNEDVTKRSIHLVPSTANASAIQAWISATCNAATQPSDAYWSSTANQTLYSNSTPAPFDSYKFAGSVLIPDGRVVFVPHYSSKIGIFNPTDDTISVITPLGDGIPPNSGIFIGGVLTPSGNVVFSPANSANVCVFDPINLTFSNAIPHCVGGGGTTFAGAVLAPTGNVIFSPFNSTANVVAYDPIRNAISNATAISPSGRVSGASTGATLLPTGNIVFTPFNTRNVIEFNTSTNEVANTASISATNGKFFSGVLTPNGNVVFIPYELSNVVLYNPSNFTFSNTITNLGTQPFHGGCLLPSGNVVFAPSFGTSNIGMFDPVTRIYSNIAETGKRSFGAGGFSGCTLLPSGRVVFAPQLGANVGILNTFLPAPPEFCLSPYVNKF